MKAGPLSFFFGIIAFLLRLLPWNHVFDSGKVYFYDPDVYVRLRTVRVLAENFPAPYVYDYFRGFPEGTGVLAPPSLEYLLAALVNILPGRLQDGRFLEIAMAVIPPLVGGITVAVLVLAVYRRLGLLPAIAAGLMLAAAPAHIEATRLGRFDNEMLEPLLLLLTFGTYLKTYDESASRRVWVVCGVWAVVYLLVWRGALFPLGIVGADILRRVAMARWSREDAGRIALNAAWLFIVPGVVLAVITGTDLWGARGQFEYNVLSWFHVVVFANAALVFYVYGLLSSRAAGRQWWLAWAGLLTLSLGGQTWILGEELLAGFKIVAGGEAWIDSINQYQQGVLFGSLAENVLGVALLLGSMAVLLWCPKFSGMKGRYFVVLWTVIMLMATFKRFRYAEYLVLCLSVGTAVVVAYWQQVAVERRGVSATKFSAAVLLGVFLAQAPAWAYLQRIYRTGGVFGFKGDVEQAVEWLREETPFPGDDTLPDQMPAYGILARWDYGGWIESVGKRPVVATNYGTETYGMEELARFITTQSEDYALEILKKNRVRYVVVDKLTDDLNMYSNILGSNQVYFDIVRNGSDQRPVYVLKNSTFNLVWFRLFFADGASASIGDLHFQPVNRLRLVYESPRPANLAAFPWEVKKIKIFEYLPGAQVLVKGRPGAQVQMLQTIESNQGRRFERRLEGVLDHEGVTRFPLIYPPKDRTGATGFVGSYFVCNGNRVDFSYGAADIESGRELFFNLSHAVINKASHEMSLP